MSGRPHIHNCPYLGDHVYEPIWAAAEAAGLCISFHAAGGGTDDTVAPARVAATPYDLHRIFATTVDFIQNATAAVDIMLSGVLHRHPTLRFAIVESGAGWVPFILETLDQHYLRYQPWRTSPDLTKELLPSELFHRQLFVNIWYETPRPDFPLDNLMFETDYPHPTCLLGAEINEAVSVKLSGLDHETREKVLWRNAARCFGLTSKDVPALALASVTDESISNAQGE
jgi:predicted TIM-barrel fold metal-dependent hydrolase